jgi:hypothetical protein
VRAGTVRKGGGSIGVQEDWEGSVGVRGGSTGTGEPTCGPTGTGEPTDQFCSSYNQKKPLIDFGRFLTYNAY